MLETGLGERIFILQARLREMDKAPRQFGPSDVAAYCQLPRPIVAIPGPVERPCERPPDVGLGAVCWHRANKHQKTKRWEQLQVAGHHSAVDNCSDPRGRAAAQNHTKTCQLRCLALTLGSPLVRVWFSGCPCSADRRQQIPGYRDANHPRPMPKAAALVPTSMSAALCGPESSPAACPNQRSPRAMNNGLAVTRTIFIRVCLDRALPTAS